MFIGEKRAQRRGEQKKALFSSICFSHEASLFSGPLLVFAHESVASQLPANLVVSPHLSLLFYSLGDDALSGRELRSPQVAFLICFGQRTLYLMVVPAGDFDGNTDRHATSLDSSNQQLFAVFHEANNAVDVCAIQA